MLARKGATSLSIVLLVFMALMLIAVALFTFVTGLKGRVEKISDARFMENLYEQENRMEYYLGEIAERAAFKSYGKNAAVYFGAGLKDINKIDEKAFEKSFFDGFKENFKEEIESSRIPELENFKTNFEGNFAISFDEGKIRAELKNFKTEAVEVVSENKRVWMWKIIPTYSYEETKRTVVIYENDLKIEKKLEGIGMLMLGALKEKTAGCKSAETEAIEISIETREQGCVAYVKSKRSFFSGEGMDIIEFGFLQK